ncbi:MAG: PAS domain-containing protein, partial [Defluviitaleaceae bacterium]|nr:PAS domain-containing protein [Defluviitaleaceae bacterium]
MPDQKNGINGINDVGGLATQDSARLLLDTSPIACRLMKRIDETKYELFECNEESIKLFKFKDKKEFMDRYFEIFPEFQPNGKNSIEEGQRLFEEAYAVGRNVTHFVFQSADGETIPSEVTLVRLAYGDDYVIAGYTRDLREQRQMMNDIRKRDGLLNTLNKVAEVLLTAANEDNFEESLLEGMELIGKHLDADNVQIWPNETIKGALHFVLKFRWLSDDGKKAPPIAIGTAVPYTERWKELFFRGEYINGPVESFVDEDRELLGPLGIVSTITLPLFYRGSLWGLFCVDDNVKKRYFSEGEIGILHSAALMFVNAINRNLQAAQIREAHDRTQLLLDTTPLAVHLWDRNMKLLNCNEETVRLFKMKDKQDYIDRFRHLSPEFQPNGARSTVQAELNIRRAFEEGEFVFEWEHRDSEGAPIPSEITLVRVAYDDDYAVAGYVRDLREQK